MTYQGQNGKNLNMIRYNSLRPYSVSDNMPGGITQTAIRVPYTEYNVTDRQIVRKKKRFFFPLWFFVHTNYSRRCYRRLVETPDQLGYLVHSYEKETTFSCQLLHLSARKDQEIMG